MGALLALDRCDPGNHVAHDVVKGLVQRGHHDGRIVVTRGQARLKSPRRNHSAALPIDVSSSEVRKRLRVSFYIEGSVRLAEDRARVLIQLVESETGRQL